MTRSEQFSEKRTYTPEESGGPKLSFRSLSLSSTPVPGDKTDVVLEVTPEAAGDYYVTIEADGETVLDKQFTVKKDWAGVKRTHRATITVPSSEFAVTASGGVVK